MPAMYAISMECWSTFWPKLVRKCRRPSNCTISFGRSYTPTSVAAASPISSMRLFNSSFASSTVSSIFAGWMRPSFTSFSRVGSATSRAVRIKGGYDHGARCLVDHKLHAGGAFQCADVAALAADDLAFQVLILQLEKAGGELGHMSACVALEGHG